MGENDKEVSKATTMDQLYGEILDSYHGSGKARMEMAIQVICASLQVKGLCIVDYPDAELRLMSAKALTLVDALIAATTI